MLFGFKTKKDKRIEYLESQLAKSVSPSIMIRRGKLIPYKARGLVRDGIPVEDVKDRIVNDLIEGIKRHIHFDISDADEMGEVIITGTIYIMEESTDVTDKTGM